MGVSNKVNGKNEVLERTLRTSNGNQPDVVKKILKHCSVTDYFVTSAFFFVAFSAAFLASFSAMMIASVSFFWKLSQLIA